MKTKILNREELHLVKFSYQAHMKKIFLTILMAVAALTAVSAQEATYEAPNWWFGVAAGANYNMYGGSTQQLNESLTVPTTFNDGDGIGLFAAALIEYRFTDSEWGIMLQSGYDSRKGSFDQVMTPCNCPADLSTDLSYITVEPSLRFAPFQSNFYLYGGPRFAFVQNQDFTYQRGVNPNVPNQVAPADVNAEFSEMEQTIISAQIGAGYDIPLTAQGKKTQFVLSPFVAFHPYFGQNPRAIETWNLTTIRAGISLKFGQGKRIDNPEEVTDDIVVSEVDFTINSPANVPGELRVTETFPLRNYIYFDKESTDISNRYVQLNKSQVKNFNGEQAEIFMSNTEIEGRSKGEMTVYYNILNILGKRMLENPGSSITLVGSSENGTAEGKLMATSVQRYLVDVFSINATRIAIEGRNKPKVSEQERGNNSELALLREGDRRVSIESNSPVLLMEYQNGPNAPLKPVQIVGVQDAPISSYVTFKVDRENEAFRTWKLEATDKNGITQSFGPYTGEEVSIPGKTILGTTPEGDYQIKMIGTSQSGEVVTKESKVHIVAWTPAKIEEGMRFSIIYEFDDATAIEMYNKYLSEVIAPNIPADAKVMIHGYTDVIGEQAYNQALSLKRAKDVQATLKNSLSKLGTTGVLFEVDGLGENENSAPFGNKLPEQRAYNRTVIIDILPNKM